jgi:hypothetical protein
MNKKTKRTYLFTGISIVILLVLVFFIQRAGFLSVTDNSEQTYLFNHSVDGIPVFSEPDGVVKYPNFFSSFFGNTMFAVTGRGSSLPAGYTCSGYGGSKDFVASGTSVNLGSICSSSARVTCAGSSAYKINGANPTFTGFTVGKSYTYICSPCTITTVIPPTPTKYTFSCSGTTCTCGSSSTGAYSTLSSCQTAASAKEAELRVPKYDFTCSGTTCTCGSVSGGAYSTLSFLGEVYLC